ncbi:MAG: hypothetical protein ACTSWV_02435 [Candidatus Asgardarchaeia archaeon]
MGMSGGQKSLVVDLTETEICKLTQDNEVADIKVNGVLSVINQSNRNRIWNATIKVSNVENTSLTEEEIKVGEVDVKGKWSKDYVVSVDQPLLRVQEIIDTAPHLKSPVPHDALPYGIPSNLLFTIRITNVSDARITNIEVLKALPQAFGNPEIQQPSAGKVMFHPKNREIVWKEFELYPNGEVELTFNATITPERGETYNAGTLVINYVAEEKTRSSLVPNLVAETGVFVGGSEEEDPRQPNRWLCTLDLMNDSDYPLKVNKTTVYQIFPDGKKEILFEEEPGVVVNPNEDYVKEFVVESPEPPSLEREVNYTIESVTKRKVIGHIEKEAKELPVIKIETVKGFIPSEVDAYTKTPMTATFHTTNTGSAVIDEVELIDDIPKDFKPPTPTDVTVSKGDTTIKDVEVELVPNDFDTSHPHKVHVRVTKLMESIGGLNPGESLNIEYPVISWNPRPTEEYLSPFVVKANAFPHVEPTVYEGDPVRIGVRYVRRKLAVFKTVQPGKSAGEYIIPLKLVNKGEVAVENVKITDFIPEGYTLTGWEPADMEPEVQETPEGTYISWRFSRIEKGNEISVKYRIEGKGPYIRKEPTVTTL